MSVQPIRWAGGALELLDQTRLPADETWLRCTTPEEVADAIRRLAVRGAPAIGVAAAYGLALAPPREREHAAGLLASTRPTAVNLRWALDRCLVAADPLAEAHAIAREQEEADRAMAAHGAALFGEVEERVLTHCNTGALATAGYGTGLGVIRAAWDAGRVREVWVDETRPLLQGSRLTAWELGRLGIPHRVITDSSAGALMARGLVDRVVVGADRIAANGDVGNKIGTYPLAVLADRHGVPFCVAAPVSTIDPATASGDGIPIEERDPAEVTTLADATNLAFDVTPAELVTVIVTEAGVLRPPYPEAIARVAAR
ncbi:MAG: S-methyl-5-thioribose-1-phosphate isomerase [Thermoleophilaceae bacterium]